jgi:urease accessory protein
MSYVKIGVGGPVGSGKTALIERLTREMSKEYSICVVTNDLHQRGRRISYKKLMPAC